jgi:hypothetical protein
MNGSLIFLAITHQVFLITIKTLLNLRSYKKYLRIMKKFHSIIKHALPVMILGSILMAGCTNRQNDEQQLLVGDDIAIAQTQYGKVQGFILRGIHQFRGIPYGESTAGKNRFMPPQPPQPWDDIRPAVWWGNTAPQIMEGTLRSINGLPLSITGTMTR